MPEDTDYILTVQDNNSSSSKLNFRNGKLLVNSGGYPVVGCKVVGCLRLRIHRKLRGTYKPFWYIGGFSESQLRLNSSGGYGNVLYKRQCGGTECTFVDSAMIVYSSSISGSNGYFMSGGYPVICTSEMTGIKKTSNDQLDSIQSYITNYVPRSTYNGTSVRYWIPDDSTRPITPADFVGTLPGMHGGISIDIIDSVFPIINNYTDQTSWFIKSVNATGGAIPTNHGLVYFSYYSSSGYRVSSYSTDSGNYKFDLTGGYLDDYSVARFTSTQIPICAGTSSLGCTTVQTGTTSVSKSDLKFVNVVPEDGSPSPSPPKAITVDDLRGYLEQMHLSLSANKYRHSFGWTKNSYSSISAYQCPNYSTSNWIITDGNFDPDFEDAQEIIVTTKRSTPSSSASYDFEMTTNANMGSDIDPYEVSEDDTYIDVTNESNRSVKFTVKMWPNIPGPSIGMNDQYTETVDYVLPPGGSTPVRYSTTLKDFTSSFFHSNLANSGLTGVLSLVSFFARGMTYRFIDVLVAV